MDPTEGAIVPRKLALCEADHPRGDWDVDAGGSCAALSKVVGRIDELLNERGEGKFFHSPANDSSHLPDGSLQHFPRAFCIIYPMPFCSIPSDGFL
jgi:hypothetical protein